MSSTNCGAFVDGKRPKTKKALREALAGQARVTFDTTSMFVAPRILEADDVQGSKLSIVGPDPYDARKWYATVERRNGHLKVT